MVYKIALNLSEGAVVKTKDNLPNKMTYGTDARGFISVLDTNGKQIKINTAHIVAYYEEDTDGE